MHDFFQVFFLLVLLFCIVQKDVYIAAQRIGVGVVGDEGIGLVAFQNDREFNGGENLHGFEIQISGIGVSGNLSDIPDDLAPALAVQK